MFELIKEKYPFIEKYEGLFERVSVPARTVLLREGDVSRRSFFIEKGCLRVWFNNKGVEVTFQFFFEGQFLSSAESFSKSIPSIFTIEAIEPTDLYVLHRRAYEQIVTDLKGNVAVMEEMIGWLFERQLYYSQEFMSFIRDTPRERYIRLLREKPHVVKRVAQHYIASYLGITPVSLSRIRSKVMREGIS